ncbi:sulfotransferase [Mesorhizobium xinjiangense]|uniref:sulfotransferase n=1 Tax=Mesorhizobium xinjiangense TaxID=2678685 RepID=UPI0012EDB430|nr:sulfotransferase [Mesorhizobium xinjiangense]
MSETGSKNADPTVRPHKRWGRLWQRVRATVADPAANLLQLPVLGELAAAVVPARTPPVLIASLPRAGSSWIGRVLGGSPGALYLREPMTQSYLDHIGRANPPFFEWPMCRDGEAYDRFATRSFRGVPRFGDTVVPDPAQWSIGKRRQRQVVVKDVNPLILARLHERHRPKIILLMRHPAAVARSFHALGWTGDQFTTRFTPETLAAFDRVHPLPLQGNFWEQAGAFQAMAQKLVSNQLAGVDHLIVRYEDVCAEPVRQFEKMFEFCGLPFSADTRREIEQSSQAQPDYRPGRYDTRRRSLDMVDRWKGDMAPEDIESVRRNYLAYRPAFYAEPADWPEAGMSGPYV